MGLRNNDEDLRAALIGGILHLKNRRLSQTEIGLAVGYDDEGGMVGKILKGECMPHWSKLAGFSALFSEHDYDGLAAHFHSRRKRLILEPEGIVLDNCTEREVVQITEHVGVARSLETVDLAMTRTNLLHAHTWLVSYIKQVDAWLRGGRTDRPPAQRIHGYRPNQHISRSP